MVRHNKQKKAERNEKNKQHSAGGVPSGFLNNIIKSIGRFPKSAPYPTRKPSANSKSKKNVPKPPPQEEHRPMPSANSMLRSMPRNSKELTTEERRQKREQEKAEEEAEKAYLAELAEFHKKEPYNEWRKQ